jgi:hypothetical protein
LALWEKESGVRPGFDHVLAESREVKSHWLQWGQLTAKNGIMYRVWASTVEASRKLLLVPDTFKGEILREVHDSITGGHLGHGKTVGKVRHKIGLD